MDSTYKIIILNKSNQEQQYLLFNEPPILTPSTKSAFSNVWIQTSGTPSPNGSQELTIKTNTFAMCGTLPAALAADVVVQEADNTAVKLTAGPDQPGTVAIMAVVDGGPAFQPPPESTPADQSFGITTRAWDNDEYSKSDLVMNDSASL